MLVFSAIVPHPPLSVPGIGGAPEQQKLKQTMAAYEQLTLELEKSQPETLILISPHAPLDPYSFFINGANELKGDLGEFGLDRKFNFANDHQLVQEIFYNSKVNDVYCVIREAKLDHGALVPLFHLTKNLPKLKVVHLAFSLRDFQKHFEYGAIIGKLCAESGKRIALVASGDLSHRLTPEAPAGYSPQAIYFDRKILDLLERKDFERIVALQQSYLSEAAECGLRSIVILLGAVQTRSYRFKLLSYEYPFGVGHLVARLV